MNTKARKRLRLIGLLMVASLAILLTFIGKWLNNQYTEEKEVLRTKLESIYDDTYEAIADSIFENTLENNFTKKEVLQNINKENSKNTNTTIISAQFGDTNEHMYPSDTEAARTAKIISRGLRSFMIKIQDGDTSSFKKLPFDEVDSNRVRNEFVQAIKHKKIGALVSWSDQPRSLILNIHGHNNWEMGFVTNYQSLVIKKISPQIGFSIFMLLLCVSAFGLAYTKTKKQIALAEQKDDFISNMSHELKTPVATAKVAIEALQKYDALNDANKSKDYLQMATWEIERLETLVSNVLSNVQLQNGTMEILKQHTEINKIIQEVITNTQPLFIAKSKQLIYINDETDIMLNIDTLHLQGTIHNILDNALKYGGDKTIVTLNKSQNNVQITIADNGVGIPDEYKNTIFEKFFRVPSGNIHDVKGYGLGLSYAKYVVEAHGGNISLQDSETGGASFIIRFPTNEN